MSDLKFGPIWLRNFSREGSAGASGGTGRGGGAAGGSSQGPGPVRNVAAQQGTSRPAQQGTKYKLADYRYGREEMLALFDDVDPPSRLSNIEALYVPHSQKPLALSTDSLEEEPRDRNSMGLNRNISGAGVGQGIQPMERYGMARGIETTRGRPRLHQPFNLTSNGRGVTHRDDNQYGDPPAPGLTRSWSSGPHTAPRNGENPDYNSNRPYFKSQARWTEGNWRRPSSTGRAYIEETEPTSGLRRLQPLGRQRPPLDKRDVKIERPTSWTTNRRPWTGEPQTSDEYLPEWATDGNEASGGTFDSSGAFHGVESPVQRSGEPHFGLARSHTQGSINIRSRSHEDDGPATTEGTQPWWNSKKSTGAEPKKFDATSIPFKKLSQTDENPVPHKADNPDKQFELPTLDNQKPPQNVIKDDEKKKKTVTFDTAEEGYHSNTVKALRKLCDEPQTARDELEKAGESFSSVMIKPDNSLRQRHQNMIPATAEAPSYTTPRNELPKTMELTEKNPDRTHNDATGSRHAVGTPMGQPVETSRYDPFSSLMANTSLDGASSNFASTSLDLDSPRQGFSSSTGSGQSEQQNNAMLKALALKLVKDTNTWYYEDPQKKLQGPFTPYEMLQWYRAGFFRSDLMIRRECDKQMRPLGSYGDVPPFAESYSDMLATMSRDALMMEYSNEQQNPPGTSHIPSEPHMGNHSLMQDRQLPRPTPGMSMLQRQPVQTAMQTSMQPMQSSMQQMQSSMQPIPNAMQTMQNTIQPMQTMQPTQMHTEPLQQSQMSAAVMAQAPMQSHLHPSRGQLRDQTLQQAQINQQNAYNAVGRNIPFPRDLMMGQAGYSASPQMQEHRTQASPSLPYRPNFGLDQILPQNMPPTTPPPVFNNNNFLMDPIIRPQMAVDSLWGQAPNYWSQSPRMMPLADPQWNANTPAIPPELPMPEQKAPHTDPTQLELQTELLRSMLAQASVLDNEPLNKRIPLDIVTPVNEPPTPDVVKSVTDPLPQPKVLDKPTVKQVVKAPSPPVETPKEASPEKTKEPEKRASPVSPPSQVPVASKPSKVVSQPTETTPTTPTNDKTAKTKETKKNKNKTNENEKKKKESKTEMKIEEVPGFVKVKKEDKKKEDKKNAITEIPAATKASQRAILDKRKNEEAKAQALEEAERKRKEEVAAAMFDKDDDDLLDKLEMKYKESENQMEKSRPASKKAPWCAPTPTATTNTEGLTLAEIQRLEREKKIESIKEQQQMFQLIAQQQQAVLQREQEINQSGYNWTQKAAKNNANNVQSLAEIQEETRRRQIMAALEDQAATTVTSVAVPQPANNTSAPWASTAASNAASATSAFFAGFWEAAPGKGENKSPAHKSHAEPQPKAVKKTKAQPSSPAKEQPRKPTPDKEFQAWCSSVLSPFASQIDVPVFVSFLKDIESPYEVRDYVKCYLGETKESTDFARNFLEKRSKLLRNATAAHLDDLSSPAPAKNPSSLSSSDYQEVKGKAKKVKKNKMLKIDARILGFSVTASEDRINVGDIDSV